MSHPPKTPEHRRAISDALRGVKKSPEHRAAMVDAVRRCTLCGKRGHNSANTFIHPRKGNR